MGDKSTARDTMKKAGVPTVPGSDGLLQVYCWSVATCYLLALLRFNGVNIFIHLFIFNFIHIICCGYLIFQSTEEAIKLAQEIGYPVMIKVY